MYVDSSAIVSIVVDEQDALELAACLARDKSPFTSSVTQVEAAIAVGRYHDSDYEFGASQVADFLDRASIRVVDVPADIVSDVMQAYKRYGKGTGHRASLNFGDCFSYALAKRAKSSLLYKGDDFTQTDIDSAL